MIQDRRRETNIPWIMGLFFVCHGLSLDLLAVTSQPHSRAHFPVPEYTRIQMAFWEAVFSKYPDDNMVIHDIDYPAVVLDVIDFKAFANKYRKGAPYSTSEQEELTARYIKRYQLAMERIRKLGRKALDYGAMEKRVFQVYHRHKEAFKQLLAGKSTIRSQSGLAEEFSRAAQRSEKLLPHMERIFHNEGIPTDLTRIAFVESMFNLSALSKVGASGIWQFMPNTAKIYMTVNRWIDERNSPLKATVAAAKLLKDNYKLLKSWPLAITAYNHGPSGIKKAIDRVKSRNIGVIAQHFNSNTFGFASRNFYAEYLAARHVYNKYYRARRSDARALGVVEARVRRNVNIGGLLNNTPLTKTDLLKYNGCLKDESFNRYYNRNLPHNYRLFIPIEHATEVRQYLGDLSRVRSRI